MNFEYPQTHKVGLEKELIARELCENIQILHSGLKDFTLERDKTRNIKFSPDKFLVCTSEKFIWENEEREKLNLENFPQR